MTPRDRIPNIGPRERRRRRRFGLVAGGVGLAGTAVALSLGIGPLGRSLLFLPFLAGAYGLLQAKEKT